MKIENVSAALGVRITDIDLCHGISECDWSAIEQAWQTRHLLCFPGLHDLSVEDQITLCDRLAPVVAGWGARTGRK